MFADGDEGGGKCIHMNKGRCEIAIPTISLTVAETNGFIASMVMAREGLAATIVPQVLVSSLGDLSGTTVLKLTDPTLGKPICLATPVRQRQMPVVQALRQVAMAYRDKKN